MISNALAKLSLFGGVGGAKTHVETVTELFDASGSLLVVLTLAVLAAVVPAGLLMVTSM